MGPDAPAVADAGGLGGDTGGSHSAGRHRAAPDHNTTATKPRPWSPLAGAFYEGVDLQYIVYFMNFNVCILSILSA